MVRFCENGYELSGYIQCMESLDCSGIGSFSSRSLLHVFTISVASFTSCLTAFRFNSVRSRHICVDKSAVRNKNIKISANTLKTDAVGPSEVLAALY